LRDAAPYCYGGIGESDVTDSTRSLTRGKIDPFASPCCAAVAWRTSRRRSIDVSCEQEEQWVESAAANLEALEQQCLMTKPGDPGYDQCRAQLGVAQGRLQQAQQALSECRYGTRLLGAEGLVTFLRVHEPGTGYGGGQSNWISADVVFKLDRLPAKAFGFELRDDEYEPVRRGMLALLREAIVHDLPVKTDYNELINFPNQNSMVIRVAISKSRPGPPPGFTDEFYAD
jgi:hypothetical protein